MQVKGCFWDETWDFTLWTIDQINRAALSFQTHEFMKLFELWYFTVSFICLLILYSYCVTWYQPINDVADSWEEAADAAATPSPSHSADTSSVPHTPDEDDDDDQDDSEREEKKKKKPVVLDSDDGPIKEPVNVIFIGHVGEWKFKIKKLICLSILNDLNIGQVSKQDLFNSFCHEFKKIILF